MLNWQTNKLHILLYPAGAGGNFFNSCLALSNDACPQNHKLLNLDQDKKIEKIFSSAKHFDFDQGVLHQFGVFLYNISNYKLLKLSYPKSLVSKSFDSRLWFINAHTHYQVEKCLSVFPNAKIIEFKNNNIFLKFRNYPTEFYNDYETMFNSIKGDSWIDENFENLSLEQKQEIIEDFPDFLYYSKNREIILDKFDIDYEFDTSSFLDSHSCVSAIEQMYHTLNLKDFDSSLIKKLYELWLDRSDFVFRT